MIRIITLGAGLSTILASGATFAQMAIPLQDSEVNVVGLAVGTAPDYYGSSKQEGGVGPYARYQFKDTERYVLLLGPQLSANLLNDKNWRAGPLVKYRFARDNDVEDRVVRQMDKIDGAVFGGAFVEYKMPLSNTRMHQIVFGGDVAGSKNGTEAHLRATYWQPLSSKLLATVGLGMTYGNNKFADTYFGVTSAHDIALYPSRGGRAYNASSGVVGWNIPVGLTMPINKEWLLSAGARYERLVGDAKSSPVVDQRGSANQWIGGVGVAYMF